MIDKKFGLSNIRSINIEDLLGRPPIKIKLDSVMDYVSGKTVLVTGGGRFYRQRAVPPDSRAFAA